MDGLLAAGAGFDFAGAAPLGFLIAGVALFAAVGALSHAHERAFSASLIYLGLGIVVSIGLELSGTNQLLDPVDDHRPVEYVTEAALMLALFAAGIRIRRPPGLRSWQSPLRLLVVAMPLTILAVALWGTVAMGLSLAAAVVLAAALAPTDPVLAGDIGVGPPTLEDQDASEPKFALTTEAGLNDGLALPFLLLAFLIAEEGGTGWVASWLAVDVAFKIGAGLALGAGLGYGLAALTSALRRRELLIADLDPWIGIAIPVLVFGVAEVASTYGFLAVFASGLAFRRYEAEHEYERRVHDGATTVEKFGELAVIFVLGSLVTLEGLTEPGLLGWALVAVLFLVIRPVLVFAALVGSPVRGRGRLWVAWFGVKGVASLNYFALAIAAGVLAEGEQVEVAWTVIAAVTASIVVHGITASALTRRWA